jgi:hypothetical protein
MEMKPLRYNEIPPYPELTTEEEINILSTYPLEFQIVRLPRDSETKYKKNRIMVQPRDYWYLATHKETGLQSGSQFLYRTRPQNELNYALRNLLDYVTRSGFTL